MKIKNITNAAIFGLLNSRIDPGAIVDVPDQIGELMVKKGQAKEVKTKPAKKAE